MSFSKLFLTSSPTFMDWTGLNPVPFELNPANHFIDELQKSWPAKAKVLLIASDPDNHQMLEQIKADTYKLYPENHMNISEIDILDSRTNLQNFRIENYQVIFLCGGHVPTQNHFFQKIQLKSLLNSYNGIIIGISAGSMNAAETVYASPEENGEAINPNYIRYIPGLGLTKLQIIPHWQFIQHLILDGFQMKGDIVLPDSHNHSFLTLNDGGYVIVLPDRSAKLYGKSSLLSNGTEICICNDNEYLDISKLNA